MKLSLFVVVVNLFSLQVLGSSIEDAEQAVKELDDLSTTNQGKLHLHMNDQANILRSQLAAMLNQTQQEIINQIDNISAKISTMAENTQSSTGVNVDRCLSTANADLNDFASELNERIGECYGNMIMTGNSMLYSTWSKNWDEYYVDYQCTKMSLEQCKNYESEGCVDNVLSNVEYSKESMGKVFTLLTADMVNQISGMNYPCRQMILQELVLYPSLILNFVGSCLESISVNTISFSC